jgi:hypothetical protein
MSEEKKEAKQELHDYAGGWIQERSGTDVPGFLKLAFPIIGLFSVGYLIVFMNGEVNHSDRGALVQKFNQATQSSSGLMYAIAAMALVYVLITVIFAIRKGMKE